MSWIGDILRIGSLMALWVVCAMAATGYGIVTFKLDEKVRTASELARFEVLARGLR